MALVECDFMISSCLNSSVTILAYSSGTYRSQLFPVHKYTCVDALQSFQSARWALRSCRLYMRRSTNSAPVHAFDISSSESGNFSPFINTFTCTSVRMRNKEETEEEDGGNLGTPGYKSWNLNTVIPQICFMGYTNSSLCQNMRAWFSYKKAQWKAGSCINSM